MLPQQCMDLPAPHQLQAFFQEIGHLLCKNIKPTISGERMLLKTFNIFENEIIVLTRLEKGVLLRKFSLYLDI